MSLSLSEKRLLPPILQANPEVVENMTRDQKLQLFYDWEVWARDKQLEALLPNQNWAHHLVLAGRGFGKSRTGAEWVRWQLESGNMKRVALVARTPADARAVMIEGESGIMSVCPPWCRPDYEPSKLRLTWPNGGMCEVYSGEKPDKLRGPQHDGYWADELAAFRFLDGENGVWSNLMMGLRLFPRDGRPRGIITTTPRPIGLIKELVKQWRDDLEWHRCLDILRNGDITEHKEAIERIQKIRLERLKLTGNEPTDPSDEVWVTTGSTLENAANWPKAALKRLLDKYAGTRLGRQELEAEILDDSPGALWNLNLLAEQRVTQLPNMSRVVVAIDPQKMHYGAARKKANDETGIVVCGRSYEGLGYVLADKSCDLKPEGWAKRAVDGFVEYQADAFVVEANAGGEMAAAVIMAEWRSRQDVTGEPIITLVHASKGKKIRAEPISTLYERRMVFHWGRFDELEEQMTTWDPEESEESPDRVDALVWGLSDLMVDRASDGDRRVLGIGTERKGW